MADKKKPLNIWIGDPLDFKSIDDDDIDSGPSWIDQPRPSRVMWCSNKEIKEFTSYREAFEHCRSVYPDGTVMASPRNLEEWADAYRYGLKELGDKATRETIAEYLPIITEKYFFPIDPVQGLLDGQDVNHVAVICCERVPEDVYLWK